MPNTPDEGLNEFLRWSPDGCWIYYASNRDKDFAIFGVSVDDGIVKRMTRHAASDVLVEPSPDGKWLAVQAMADGQNHVIYLVPTDGGPEIRLGEEHGLLDAEMPDWSPDSRQIAFVSADKGMYDVAIYDLASRAIEWLTHGDCEYYSPIVVAAGRSAVVPRQPRRQLRSGAARSQARPGDHPRPAWHPQPSAFHAPTDQRWSSRMAARRIRPISGRCA